MSSHLENNLSRNVANREGLNVVRNTEILKNSSLTNKIYTPDKRSRSEDSKTCVQDTPVSSKSKNVPIIGLYHPYFISLTSNNKIINFEILL